MVRERARVKDRAYGCRYRWRRCSYGLIVLSAHCEQREDALNEATAPEMAHQKWQCSIRARKGSIAFRKQAQLNFSSFAEFNLKAINRPLHRDNRPW
jgi:hypothetical protein